MDIESLEVGELVSGVFLVADAKPGVDRRGQNYYSLVLNAEKGRSIEAKVWADNIGAKLGPGMGVEIMARVDQYQGNVQLNVQRYKVLPAGEFDPSPYVRTATVDVNAAFETLFNWGREEFRDPCLKAVMLEFYRNEAFAREFKLSPAASFHHHNSQGGLAEHTLEVWQVAQRLHEQFQGPLNLELLLASAALHDVGKVRCYTLTAGVSQPSDLGQLLDHIFISASMVSNVWDRVVTREVAGGDPDGAACTKALLLHVVLSHHGRREWGAPVIAQIPEAVLLHYCDQVSAAMRACFDAFDSRTPGEAWTGKVYLMDTPRRLYVPPTVRATQE